MPRLDDLTLELKADYRDLDQGLDRADRRIHTHAQDTQRRLSQAEARTQRYGRTARESFREVANAATIASAAIAGLTVASVNISANAETSLLALSGSINESLADTISIYGSEISRIRRDLGGDFSEIADAVEKAVSAGFRAPEQAAFIAERALQAAQAGLVGQADVLVRAATSTASAISGLDASITEIDDAINLVLRTAQLADTAVEEMAPAFLTTTQAATSYGVSMQEAAVATGLLARDSRTAQEAAFNLLGALRSLVQAQTQTRIEEVLGITPQEVNQYIEQGALFELINELDNRLATFGTERARVFREVFRTDQTQRTLNLLFRQLGEVDGAMEHVSQSTKLLDQTTADLEGTLQHFIDTAQSNFGESLRQSFDEIRNEIPTQEFEDAIRLADVAGQVLGNIAGRVVQHIELFGLAAGAVVAYYAAITSLAAVRAAIASLAALGTAIITPIGAVVALTAAVAGLALLASRLTNEFQALGNAIGGTFFASIALVVGQIRVAILEIRFEIERLQQRLFQVTEGIVNLFRRFGRLFNEDIPDLQLLDPEELMGLRDELEEARNTVAELAQIRNQSVASVGSAVIGIGTSAVDEVKNTTTGVLNVVSDLFDDLAGRVLEFFGVVEDGLELIDVDAISALRRDVELVGPPRPGPGAGITQSSEAAGVSYGDAFTRGALSGVGQAARSGEDVGETIVDGIRNSILDAALQDLFDPLSDFFSNAFKGILNGLGQALGGVGSSIGGFLGGLFSAQSGRLVPGPSNEGRLAIVHGQERITPPGRRDLDTDRPIQVIFQGITDRDFERRLNRALPRIRAAVGTV